MTKPTILNPADKRIVLLGGLVALACLISFGAGILAYQSGVEDAQSHVETMARIENGIAPDSPLYLAMTLVFTFGGLVLVFWLFARLFSTPQSKEERQLRREEEAQDRAEEIAERRAKLDARRRGVPTITLT